MHEGTVGASVSGRTAGREGGDRAAAGFGRRRAVLAVIRVELMQLRIIAPYLLIMPAGMIIPDLVMGESKNTGVSILFALWWPLLVGATFSMAASLSGSRLYVSLPVRRADVINAYWLMIGGLLIVYLAPFAAIFRSWPRSAKMAAAFLIAPPTDGLDHHELGAATCYSRGCRQRSHCARDAGNACGHGRFSVRCWILG